MVEEEEVVVKIEEDPAEKPEDDSKEAVTALQTQFDELQKESEARKQELLAERQRAMESARQAERARHEAASAHTQIADSQLESVMSGLSSAESDATSAEGEYAAAMEKADFVAAAKAQRRMASAESRITQLNIYKTNLEAQKTQVQHPDRTGYPEGQSQYGDPIERFIETRTEPTKQWLRAHREWVTDPTKNTRLTAAHWDAMKEGLQVDTPDYFKHVETQIGLRQERERDEGGKFVAEKPKRVATPPAAPVNGGGAAASTGSSDGNMVRLNPREAASATDGTLVWNYDDPNNKFKKGDPIGVQEMARRKREMTRKGLYDKSMME